MAKVGATNQLEALIVGAPEELRAELDRLVAAIAPWLLELPGVGPISAAQVLVSWRTPGGCARRPPSLPWLVPPDPGILRAGDQALAEPFG